MRAFLCRVLMALHRRLRGKYTPEPPVRVEFHNGVKVEFFKSGAVKATGTFIGDKDHLIKNHE